MSNANPDYQQRNQAIIDAENYIKKGYEIIQREASRVRGKSPSTRFTSHRLLSST